MDQSSRTEATTPEMMGSTKCGKTHYTTHGNLIAEGCNKKKLFAETATQLFW